MGGKSRDLSDDDNKTAMVMQSAKGHDETEREHREAFERIKKKKRHGGRKWANRGAGNP